MGFSRFWAGFCLFLGCSGSTPAASPDAATEAATDAASDAPRGPKPGDPCATGRDCDDGVFCNGVEECLGGLCASARNAACRDPGGCAASVCDEAAGGCAIDESAGTCASGVCLQDLGCTDVPTCAGDAECDDKRSCTDDKCSGGRCVHLPVDARCPGVGACGVGVCLGDEVDDATGCGTKPDAAKCKSEEGCDGARCVPLKTSCTRDLDCGDGTLCDGVERCDGGRCVHGARTTCVARDGCHHATCRVRTLGDPFCRDVKLPLCP